MRGNDKKPRTLMRISVTEQHAAKLQSLLRYDAETGKFYWLVDRYGRNGARSGDVAGWKHDNGYWYIRTAGSKYGHVTHLGRFNTPEEASAAYKAARAKAFGEFSA